MEDDEVPTESAYLSLRQDVKDFRAAVEASFAAQWEILSELQQSRARRRPSGGSSKPPPLRPPSHTASAFADRGRSKSNDQMMDRFLQSYGFPDLRRPCEDEAFPHRNSKRPSETSLLSLESAPDEPAPVPTSPTSHTSPVLMKSPSSQGASQSATNELIRTLSSRRHSQRQSTAEEDEPQETHPDTSRGVSSTGTFVHLQMHEQHRKAEIAARKHSDKKLSSIAIGTISARTSDLTPITQMAERVTASPLFMYVIMTVIVINMILLGVEVDVTARMGQDDIPFGFVVANAVVVSIFLVELTLLLISMGFRTFFCGPDRSWNIFDFGIITWSVLESSIELWAYFGSSTQSQVSSASQLRFVRTMRLVRAFRGVRVVRLLRYVSALRTLVLSIISSMASLCWTLALLVLLFYSFGIVFTQLVMDHCRDEAVRGTGDPNAIPQCTSNEDLYWSSVPESMLTLFMAITGGQNWIDALIPLRIIGPLAVACFILYIAIAVLAVVNVVTGVFCSTAMESAAADKEIATMKQLHKKNAQVADLRRVFEEIQDVESNLVNIKEFKEAMLLPKFANFLESMSISTEDIGILFTVMDSDRSGLIDLDEFVQGCLQLHGPAKSLQIARMSFENKITRQAIKSIGGALIEMREDMERIHESIYNFHETFSV